MSSSVYARTAPAAQPAVAAILLPIEAAAAALSISPMALRRLTTAGRLRKIKLGSSARWLVSDLQRFAEEIAAEQQAAGGAAVDPLADGQPADGRQATATRRNASA